MFEPTTGLKGCSEVFKYLISICCVRSQSSVVFQFFTPSHIIERVCISGIINKGHYSIHQFRAHFNAGYLFEAFF